MENALLSPVKRERLRRLQQQKRKIEMRAALPILTRDQIRRYRLPLHEALLAELEENNFVSSKAYLEQLIDYQRTMKEREGPNSIIWLWPDLINQHADLELIYNTLKTAETAQAENNIQLEFDELLKLGTRYAFGNKIWWWLGEQFLIQCVDVVKGCGTSTDRQKREALINYIYGRFLMLNKKEYEKSVPYLVKSRSLSKSMSWKASLVPLDRKEENLFVETSHLLFAITFKQATDLQLTDPVKALKVFELARKYASNACDRSLEADGLLYQGICYLLAALPRKATVVLLKSLLLNEKLLRHEEVCKARINLALAYIKVDNFDEAIKHLEALKAYAEEKDLPYYIGQTYRYLGEYYINQGEAQQAIPILQKAVLIFHNLNAAYERMQVNNFCAIASGQVLLRNYIHLIVKSGYPENRHHLFKLIDWKDSRVKFCDDEETNETVMFAQDDEDRRDSVESTMAVYRIQHEEMSEIKKGMSRIFLSSVQLTRYDKDNESMESASVSTVSSKSLEALSLSNTIQPKVVKQKKPSVTVIEKETLQLGKVKFTDAYDDDDDDDNVSSEESKIKLSEEESNKQEEAKEQSDEDDIENEISTEHAIERTDVENVEEKAFLPSDDNAAAEKLDN